MGVTMKRIFVTMQVIIAIVKERCVCVNDMATFLNVFMGTTTVTGEKINKMLVYDGYQVLTDDLGVDDFRSIKEYIAPTKYTPTVMSDGLYAVEVSQYEDGNAFLIWKASILLDIFDFNWTIDSKDLAQTIIDIAHYYNLINEKKEKIDKELLIRNIDYLKFVLETKDVEKWSF